jgi:hypothetical protein
LVSTLALSGFPTTTVAGTAHSFTVPAKDAHGNSATGYTGTLHFSSSDPLPLLPANSTVSRAETRVAIMSLEEPGRPIPAALTRAGTLLTSPNAPYSRQAASLKF